MELERFLHFRELPLFAALREPFFKRSDLFISKGCVGTPVRAREEFSKSVDVKGNSAERYQPPLLQKLAEVVHVNVLLRLNRY
jgi:hypothetical protein